MASSELQNVGTPSEKELTLSQTSVTSCSRKTAPWRNRTQPASQAKAYIEAEQRVYELTRALINYEGLFTAPLGQQTW